MISQDQYSDIAEAWIEIANSERNAYRLGVLDAWMLTAVGEVAGKDIIDLGCGEGRFSRMLATRGARVVGVDCCKRFIEYATAHRVGGDSYQLGTMEELPCADQSFDLAVSYITLVDVPELQPVLQEAYRVLRPGGRFVVCNLMPMATAGNHWIKDDVGNKLTFYLDNYFDESIREMPMCGGVVMNYHRTLSTDVNAFLATGFQLIGLQEPKPTPEQCMAYPDVDDLLRVPLFAIYDWRKYGEG